MRHPKLNPGALVIAAIVGLGGTTAAQATDNTAQCLAAFQVTTAAINKAITDEAHLCASTTTKRRARLACLGTAIENHKADFTKALTDMQACLGISVQPQ